MNPSAALALPLVAVVIWLLSRRRPLLTRAHLAVQPSAAPSALIGAAAPTAAAGSASGACSVSASAPAPAAAASQHRQLRLKALKRQFAAGPEQRLEALQQPDLWTDRAALPLLQRGLRDPHPAVVRAAAAAIARFRGRTAAALSAGLPGDPVRLPRNARPRP